MQDEGQCPQSCRIQKTTDKVGGSLFQTTSDIGAKKEMRRMSNPICLTKNEFAYEKLKAGIITGEFNPGQHLVISKLTQQFRISAIPIREAITRLIAEGLLIQTPHVGATVVVINLMELKENYLIRTELEGLATQHATQYLTEKDFQMLRKNIELMRRLIMEKKFGKIRPVNQEFHRIIYAACPYKKLYKIISELLNQINSLQCIFTLVPHRAEYSLQQHIDILDALQKRDAHLAQNLAEENTRSALKDLESYFNSGSGPLLYRSFSENHGSVPGLQT